MCIRDRVGELNSPNPMPGDDFGYSLDILGDYLIIGSPGHNDGHGAAYLFKRINDNWEIYTVFTNPVASDNKGLIVKPEECDLEILIKKSQIAMSSTDARPSRFVGGERIDAAISELNFEKRKVSLSIKLLEEIMNAKAIKEHSSPLSGKNLPFSSLSEQLDDKKKNKDNE